MDIQTDSTSKKDRGQSHGISSTFGLVSGSGSGSSSSNSTALHSSSGEQSTSEGHIFGLFFVSVVSPCKY